MLKTKVPNVYGKSKRMICRTISAQFCCFSDVEFTPFPPPKTNGWNLKSHSWKGKTSSIHLHFGVQNVGFSGVVSPKHVDFNMGDFKYLKHFYLDRCSPSWEMCSRFRCGLKGTKPCSRPRDAGHFFDVCFGGWILTMKTNTSLLQMGDD